MASAQEVGRDMRRRRRPGSTRDESEGVTDRLEQGINSKSNRRDTVSETKGYVINRGCVRDKNRKEGIKEQRGGRASEMGDAATWWYEERGVVVMGSAISEMRF